MCTTSYIICGAQCEMKIQDSLFENYEEPQASNIRILNPAWGPVCLHRLQARRASPECRDKLWRRCPLAFHQMEEGAPETAAASTCSHALPTRWCRGEQGRPPSPVLWLVVLIGALLLEDWLTSPDIQVLDGRLQSTGDSRCSP